MKNKAFLDGLRSGLAACAAVWLAAGCASTKTATTDAGFDAGDRPGPSSGGRGGVMLGIDVLESDGFAPLRGKRVGLITNQTSVNRRGEKTRVVLHRAPEVNLTALFTPEHGLDGAEKAGNKVASRRDPITGLTAFSLYGDTRKPTPEMLRNVDVLVFDLQDIGCRSYTYISTMVLAMEAAGEHDKEFLVLDRPNPLGGLRIQGPGLEKKWQSFVGQIPVPYVHGMTAGELALMTAGEGWIESRPALGVVKMRGWDRSMVWEDTGLRWVPTSPNVPKASTPRYYVATGILGGLGGVDIGIGTGGPFEFAGSKEIDGEVLARAMDRYGFSGVDFVPYVSTASPGFSGVQLRIDPRTDTDLAAVDLALIAELNRMRGGRLIHQTPEQKMTLFHKVAGSAEVAESFRRGVDPRSVSSEWASQHRRFQAHRTPYLLYGTSGPTSG